MPASSFQDEKRQAEVFLNKPLLLLSLAIPIGLVVWLILEHVPALQVADLWFEDVRVGHFSPPEPPSSQVVVLGITEGTLEHLPYRTPIDRGLLAEVIENLDKNGVRAIGLDLLLDQPTEPAKDERLMAVLAATRAPVTVAWVDRIHEQAVMTPRQREAFARFREQSGVRVGLANFRDRDVFGAVRNITVGREESDGGLSGFAVEVAESVGVPYASDDHAIDYRARPSADEDPFAIYEIRPGQVSSFPPPSWVEDKIVLIGAVRPYEDRHATPLNAALGENAGTLPGVVIHAHILDQLLEGRQLPRTPGWLSLLLALLLSLGGVGLAALDKPIVFKMGAAVLGAVGFATASIFLFSSGGLLLPVIMPTLGFCLAAAVGSALLGRRYRAQQRFLRRAFSAYIPPTLVTILQRDPSRLRLGGVKRELTFIFTDIAGFTSMSEEMDAEDLSNLMNAYFEGMVAVLFEHGGTLDKFIGDALVCIFGAPVDQEDHVSRAVSCALAMDEFAQRFIVDQKRLGIEFGPTRIGVHTGIASVGNFGTKTRFNFTALGDVVNTAARLEGANKYLGTRICVSGATAGRCDDHTFRPVGDLVLKGRTAGLPVFEPLADGRWEASGGPAYLRAFHLMEAEKPELAAQAFAELQREHADDPLVALHIKRLESGAEGIRIVLESK